jgi:Ser/Thr protein kinase RdoA (MazF antagonist)
VDACEAQEIPARFGIDAVRIDAVDSGLVNRTFVVTDRGGARHILQWVNPVFGEDVNEDIDAVTAHVAARGLLTPRLLRTSGGAASVPGHTGRWRMMTCIDGVTVHRAESDRVAREAGLLLGRFHVAVSDFTRPFRQRRPFVHDTARHLARLRDALGRRRDHLRYRHIAPLAEAILAEAEALPPLPALPERVVHGDPKISNVLFHRDTGAALCMVDLDTVGRMALPLELGDALRSWCNLAGEDARRAAFSPDRFRAALAGYAEGAPALLTLPEIASLVPATRRIGVELAARFCTDALDENYFGWDPARFPTHSEHSEVRAAGQLDAAQAVARQAPALDRIVAALLPC